MNIKASIIAFALMIGMTIPAMAQVKIGYTNIELILAYMPESKQVEQQLSIYQKKLQEKIQIKQEYAQTKLQEYMDKAENKQLSPDQEKAAQEELTKLDTELQKEATDSENKLMSKREELLVPLLEKLQKAIDDVAEEKGYDYILNQTTSAGVSTILFGPEEDDLTEPIMKKLGIQVPEK